MLVRPIEQGGHQRLNTADPITQEYQEKSARRQLDLIASSDCSDVLQWIFGAKWESRD